MGFRERLQAAWFQPDLAAFLLPLLPLSWLFRGLVALRRQAFRCGLLPSEQLAVPVIVVGNLIVGGAGKTPAVIWLVERLIASGWHPGILSRGYGASDSAVSAVDADSNPQRVGDEPVLLAKRTGVAVFVGRRRVDAGLALLAAHPEVDILVCDDGLQHYRLVRDIELAVFDGRVTGNRQMLPAGPLREPLSRLHDVDAIVFNLVGGADESIGKSVPGVAPRFYMQLSAGEFYGLQDAKRLASVGELATRKLYAIAGIGHPERFLTTLAGMGLSVQLQSFPDHHAYSDADLSFAKDGILLMTEKDAIKCRSFYSGEAWVLPVCASIEPDLAAFVLEKLNGRQVAGNTGLPPLQGPA